MLLSSMCPWTILRMSFSNSLPTVAGRKINRMENEDTYETSSHTTEFPVK
jgi:hypothetical protein